MTLKKQLRKFFRDERGQTTTEYILILLVVVMIVSKMRTSLQDKLISAVNKLGGSIDKFSNDVE